jgi:DNA polymerase-3 subunit delta'
MRFADIIGQEDIKQRLVRTVEESRVSHAQLFLGPEGSGKLALAVAYAQYINCTNKQDGDSCGECPSCIKYQKFIHPDLHFIYPTAKVKNIEKPMSKDFISQWRELLLETNSYINLSAWYAKLGMERKQAIINARDCNEIIKTLSYKSYESEYKVMIIWMVEKLFHAAAPKILKVLEEPPDKTLFLLVSENQDLIINTILSRTQLIKIGKLSDTELTKALIRDGYEPAQANDAVRIADGNYLAAVRLISQSEEERYNFLNFREWMRNVYQFDVEKLIKFVADMSKNSREKNKSFLNYALRFTHESLLMNYNSSDLVRVNNEESDFIGKFYPFINERNSHLIAEELDKSIYHIERNANPSVLFMDLSLKLAKWLRKKD